MNKYWIWFSRINLIGAKTQNELLEKYKTPEKIWKLTEEKLEKELDETQLKIVLDKKYRQNLKEYEQYMLEHGIKMITIQDENYPEKLKNIYDPPVAIYVKGNINILKDKSIAIVGSRECSKYGEKMAKQFAYNLSKHNINIISGLARGIDTYAHLGAILAGKPTIAVVGCGLDSVYPRENEEIFNKIIKNGAVVSEYVIGTKPYKMNFPARNRIISGLSDGICVVEAGLKSGTAITVEFGLEQGKNIYAIPGNINNYTSMRNK